MILKKRLKDKGDMSNIKNRYRVDYVEWYMLGCGCCHECDQKIDFFDDLKDLLDFVSAGWPIGEYFEVYELKDGEYIKIGDDATDYEKLINKF